MGKDYSVYKFYKGEKENPFEKILEAHEIDKSKLPPPECMNTEYDKTITSKQIKTLENSSGFWELESVFENLYIEKESSDWFYMLGNDFMKLLKGEKDYNKPTDKKGVLNLWLKYLITETEKLTKENFDWYNNY